MSPSLIAETIASLDFPRVSGDEPHLDLSTHSEPPFSPRERG